MEIQLRKLEPSDWAAVRAIYLEGIATGQATFETEAPDWAEWDATHLPVARISALRPASAHVIGWAALGHVSARKAYAGVAEVSVYVAAKFAGQGVGRRLLERLIEESEQNDIWMLQSSIFPENAASLRLHEACGFRTVGRRERISKLNGVWRDTLILERRSRVVGIT